MRENRHFEFLDPAGVLIQLHLDDGVEPTYDLGEPCVHLLLQDVYAIIESLFHRIDVLSSIVALSLYELGEPVEP